MLNNPFCATIFVLLMCAMPWFLIYLLPIFINYELPKFLIDYGVVICIIFNTIILGGFLISILKYLANIEAYDEFQPDDENPIVTYDYDVNESFNLQPIYIPPQIIKN